MLSEAHCRAKLQLELCKKYTKEQEEDFAWYSDRVEADKYEWEFNDHKGKNVIMTCNRETGEVTTR